MFDIKLEKMIFDMDGKEPYDSWTDTRTARLGGWICIFVQTTDSCNGLASTYASACHIEQKVSCVTLCASVLMGGCIVCQCASFVASLPSLLPDAITVSLDVKVFCKLV